MSKKEKFQIPVSKTGSFQYPHICFLASVSGFQLESTLVLRGKL